MKNRVWLAVLVVMTFALGGCADKMIRDDDDTKTPKSLVFGYIDMDEAPIGMDWLSVRQVLPKTDKPFIYSSTDDGMFWGAHYVQGSYQIDSFGGHRAFGNVYYTFYFPRQYMDSARFKIDKTGLYYLGSYKYKKVKTGFFEADKFDFEKTNSPSERELLERMLPYTQSKNWEARIKRRIAELSK